MIYKIYNNIEEFQKNFAHFYPNIRLVSLLYHKVPLGFVILCANDIYRSFYLTRLEKGWKLSASWNTFNKYDINATQIVNFILPLYNEKTILDRTDPIVQMILNDTKDSIDKLTPKYIVLGKERFDFME